MLPLAVLVDSLVSCDQATKHVARLALADGSSRSFLGGVVHFTLAGNPGGFLSLGDALSPPARLLVFTVATAAFLVGVLVALGRSRPPIRSRTGAGLTLLAAGGLGNLVDRLSQQGVVTDFCVVRLGLLHTGVFNLADMAILLGVILLFLASAGSSRATA